MRGAGCDTSPYPPTARFTHEAGDRRDTLIYMGYPGKMSTVDVPNVPRVQRFTLLAPESPGCYAVLVVTYVRHLTVGATYIGQLTRRAPSEVEAVPFIWSTHEIDLSRRRTFACDDEATRWLIEEAERAHEDAMSRSVADVAVEVADDLQGGLLV